MSWAECPVLGVGLGMFCMRGAMQKQGGGWCAGASHLSRVRQIVSGGDLLLELRLPATAHQPDTADGACAAGTEHGAGGDCHAGEFIVYDGSTDDGAERGGRKEGKK
jgi:hypothetical protein